MISKLKSIKILTHEIILNSNTSKLPFLKTNLGCLRDFLLDPINKNAKNSTDRKRVEDASNNPILLTGFTHEITLTSDLIKDILFLSDLFTINELDALELVLAAQGSMKNRNRLLSSIFLFYEHILAAYEALRYCIQAKPGKTWASSLEKEPVDVIWSFLKELLNNEIIKISLNFLTNFNILQRLEILTSSGIISSDSSYRCTLESLLLKIRFTVSEMLLYLCLQFSMPISDVNRLLDYSLKSLENIQTQGFTFELMNIIFAILYSITPFSNPITIDQAGDLTSIEMDHEIFNDSSNFYSKLSTWISTKYNEFNTNELNIRVGFLALVRLALSTTQSKIIPLRNELFLGVNPDGDEISEEQILASEEEIDTAVNWSLENGALEFIHEILLTQQNFHSTPFTVIYIHTLMTDLISMMPLQIRELRLKDEDTFRRTGEDPSSQGFGFARLLNLLTDLYDVIGSPLHARLAIEYWWPSSNESSDNSDTKIVSKTSNETCQQTLLYKFQTSAENLKQAALLRFVRQCSDMIMSAHVLFVPFLKFLKALSGCKSAATHCFNMLHSSTSSSAITGLTTGGTNLVSWEHFVNSLNQYWEHLSSVQGHSGANVYQSSSVDSGISPAGRNIQPEEMDGLIAVLQLIRRVSTVQPKIASMLCADQKLQLPNVCFGLLSCPVSISLKAELLKTITAFAKVNSMRAITIWNLFASSSLFGFFVPVSGTGSQADNQFKAGGLQIEMNELEPRIGEYPLTRAFLAFVTVLAPQIWSFYDNNRWLHGSRTDESMPPSTNFGLYHQDSSEVVNQRRRVANAIYRFIIDSIFFKHGMRMYSKPEEKGQISSNCIVLFNLMIRQFVDRLNNLNFLTIFSQTNGEIMDHIFSSDSSVYDKFSISKETLGKHSLPSDWPHNDPGYQLSNSILVGSQIFRLIVNLLHLNSHVLHKCREQLSRLNSSGCVASHNNASNLAIHLVGIPRATLAALDLFLQLACNENHIIALTRHIATHQSSLSSKIGANSHSSLKSSLIEPSSSLVPLALFTKLLVGNVNCSTGLADFPNTLMRYVAFGNFLPQHSMIAMDLFQHIVHRQLESDLGHRQLLVQLFSSPKDSLDILSTLVNCLDEDGVEIGVEQQTLRMVEDKYPEISSQPNFNDLWTYSIGPILSWDPQSALYGFSQLDLASPNQLIAAIHAAIPILNNNWPTQFLTCWNEMPSWNHLYTATFEKYFRLQKNDLAFSVPCSYRSTGIRRQVLNLLLHVLKSVDEPNFTHWAFGFSIDDLVSFKNSVLQDVGVADSPKTCLHAMLTIISRGMNVLRSCLSQTGFGNDSVTDFDQTVLELHWDIALIWEILYFLAADKTAGVILLRYLRNNHDLLAQQVLNGILSYSLPSTIYQSVTKPEEISSFKNILLSAISAQQSWLLRLIALELFSVSRGISSKTYTQKLLRLIAIPSRSSSQHVIGDIDDDLISDCTSITVKGKGDNEKDAFIIQSLIVTMVQHALKVRSVANYYREHVSACPISPKGSDPAFVNFQNKLVSQSLIGCFKELNIVKSESVKSLSTFKNLIQIRAAVIDPTKAIYNLYSLISTHFVKASTAQESFNATEIVSFTKKALLSWAEKFNLHSLLCDSSDSLLSAWLEVVGVSGRLMLDWQNSQALSLQTNFLLSDAPASIISSGIQHFQGLELIKLCIHAVLNVLEKIHELFCELSTGRPLHTNDMNIIGNLTSGCLNLCAACTESRTIQDFMNINPSHIPVLEWSREDLSVFVDCIALTTSLIPLTQSSKKSFTNLCASLTHLLRLSCILDPLMPQNLTAYDVEKSLDDQEAGPMTKHCYQIMSQVLFHVDSNIDNFSVKNTPINTIKEEALMGQPIISRLTAISVLSEVLDIEKQIVESSHNSVNKTLLVKNLLTESENFVSVRSSFYPVTYFQLLTQSILEDIDQIDNYIVGQKETLPMADLSVIHFAFQIKMSLICRIASTKSGAQILDQTGLILSLAKCNFFSKCKLSSLIWEQLARLTDNEGKTIHQENNNGIEFASKVLLCLNKSIDNVSGFTKADFDKILSMAISVDPINLNSENEAELLFGIHLSVMRLFQAMAESLGLRHESFTNHLTCFFQKHHISILHDSDVNALDKPLLILLLTTRQESINFGPDRLRFMVFRYLIALETVVSHLATIHAISSSTAHNHNKKRIVGDQKIELQTSNDNLLVSVIVNHVSAQVPVLLESIQVCLKNSSTTNVNLLSPVSRFNSLNINTSSCLWAAVERELSTTQQFTLLSRLLATIHSSLPSREESVNLKEIILPFSLEFEDPNINQAIEPSRSMNCLSTLIKVIQISLSLMLSVERKCVRIVAIIERQLAPFLNELKDIEDSIDNIETNQVGVNRAGNRALSLILKTNVLRTILNPFDRKLEISASSGHSNSLALDELRQLVSTIYENGASYQWLNGESSKKTSIDKSQYRRDEPRLLSKLARMGSEELLEKQMDSAKTCLQMALFLLWRHLEFCMDHAAKTSSRSNLSSKSPAAKFWTQIVNDSELDRCWLSQDLFDQLNHSISLSYMTANDQLYLKAISKRLERFVHDVKQLRQSKVQKSQDYIIINVFQGLGRTSHSNN